MSLSVRAINISGYEMTLSIMAFGDDFKETHLLLLLFFFLLSFLVVFITEFISADCRKWLPSKKLFNFYSRPSFFVLVLTSTNNKARHRYQEVGIAGTVERSVFVDFDTVPFEKKQHPFFVHAF